MDPVVEVAAPAQPDAPPELTAAEQAVASDDVSAFRSARQAERGGKPLAPAPVAEPADDDDVAPIADPAAAAPPVRQLSKRQQQINDYERRIAEQTAEITRLKAAPPPATPAPRGEQPSHQPANEPSEVTFPAVLQTYEAYLEANPTKQYEDFSTARALHVFREEGKQAQVHGQRTARITKYQERLTAIRAADPTFDLAAIRPEVGGLVPLDYLGPDQPWTMQNVIAQEILLSEHPDRLLRHFHDHPEDLQRLSGLSQRDVFREMGQLEMKLTPHTAPRETAPPPSITTAPPPPTTLGSRPADATDPVDAAVASGDMTAFKAARLRERTANLR